MLVHWIKRKKAWNNFGENINSIINLQLKRNASAWFKSTSAANLSLSQGQKYIFHTSTMNVQISQMKSSKLFVLALHTYEPGCEARHTAHFFPNLGLVNWFWNFSHHQIFHKRLIQSNTYRLKIIFCSTRQCTVCLFSLFAFFFLPLQYPSAPAMTEKLVQTEKLSFMSLTGKLHISRPKAEVTTAWPWFYFSIITYFDAGPSIWKCRLKHWFFPRCWWEISHGWGVSLVLDHIITTNGDIDIYIHTSIWSCLLGYLIHSQVLMENLLQRKRWRWAKPRYGHKLTV